MAKRISSDTHHKIQNMEPETLVYCIIQYLNTWLLQTNTLLKVLWTLIVASSHTFVDFGNDCKNCTLDRADTLRYVLFSPKCMFRPYQGHQSPWRHQTYWTCILTQWSGTLTQSKLETNQLKLDLTQYFSIRSTFKIGSIVMVSMVFY